MRQYIAATALGVVFLMSSPIAAASQYPSAKGRDAGLCHEIVGKSASDLEHLKTFCSKGLVEKTIVGAIGDDSLLYLKVSRDFAEAMRADRLSAEQLVKNWMTVWRSLTSRHSVTVTVEWQDVEVAKGEATILHGDRVTIR